MNSFLHILCTNFQMRDDVESEMKYGGPKKTKIVEDDKRKLVAGEGRRLLPHEKVAPATISI